MVKTFCKGKLAAPVILSFIILFVSTWISRDYTLLLIHQQETNHHGGITHKSFLAVCLFI